MGASPAAVSGIDEAKALAPETGSRPGGKLRQPGDSPSARAIAVQKGDTLYDISRRYSVNMRALIETNRLEPPYALDTGNVIYLPPPNIHVVERGETLYSVSRRYNVDTRSLALLNNMARPWTVWPGDELVLPPLARDQSRDQSRSVQPAPVIAKAEPSVKIAPPVTKPPATKPPAAPIVAAKADKNTADTPIALIPGPEAVAAVKVQPKPPVQSQPAAPVKVAQNTPGSREFIWPVSGDVLKGFGPGSDGIRNDGVNIAASKGAEVKAAAGGEVVYAGSELAGFGNLILIRHPGGWVTAYAHSDSIKVKEGDLVRQGQTIASAGATGNANSPQVHFELRKGKEPVDPSLHLPPLKG